LLEDQVEFSNAICLHEAKCFYKAVRLARMSFEEAKELITVPPLIDAALRGYVHAYPADGHITMVLDYRTNLWAELEQLLARGRKRCRSELQP
jgi:hypothetical protein